MTTIHDIAAEVQIRQGLATLTARAYHDSQAAGWHDGPVDVPRSLCLIHSEISEALEGHRKGLMDTHLPWRPMIEVELADAVIRIADLAAALDLDLAGAVIEKMAYNRTRADHKPEARAQAGGKKF